MQMIFVKTHVNFQFCVVSGIRVFTVTFKAQFDETFEGSFPFADQLGSLHDLITWSMFGKHENRSLLKNFVTQAERAY